MSKQLYVAFGDSFTDPTFTCIDDAEVVIVTGDNPPETLGEDALIGVQVERYSVALMLEALDEAGLLHRCR